MHGQQNIKTTVFFIRLTACFVHLRIKERETRLTLHEHDDDDVQRGSSAPCLFKNSGPTIVFWRQSALKTDFREFRIFSCSSCGFSALHNRLFFY